MEVDAKLAITSDWADKLSVARNVAGTALIAKACDILEIVGKSPGEVSQVILAEKTGIPRATLYRIIAALSARGLIRADPVTQNYTLGFGFLELAQNAWSSSDLASIASVELRRLRDLTGETAYLAVQQGYHVLALGRFESAHPQRSKATLGALKPMHCTSQGKSILAHLTEAQVDMFLKQDLHAFTHRTITDPRQLKANLAIIRARGFAIDDEEIVLGTRCVGAPILDFDNRPVAAISVAAPTYRMNPDRAEQLGHEIADIARRISSQLQPAARTKTLTENNFIVSTTIPAFAGGSPIWQADRETLFWIDRLAPAIHGLGGDPAHLSLEMFAESATSACLLEDGALLATESRLVLVRGGCVAEVIACKPGERVTALRVSGSGQVWAAVLNEDADTTKVGALHSDGTLSSGFEVGGVVTDMVFGGEDTLFVTVPLKSSIYLFEVHRLRKRRFSDIPKAAGTPGAMAVDAAGKLWVAMSDGWSILKLDENGDIVRTIAIPVPHPTGIAFGGPDLTVLYITSTRAGLPRESLIAAPLSGHVLSVDVGERGVMEPVGRFA